jgi:hypothetical protein
MIRIALSFMSTFILLYLESLIVIKVFQYENGITFDNYNGLWVVLILNFFLTFSILTHLTPWFMRMNQMEMDEDEETQHLHK